MRGNLLRISYNSKPDNYSSLTFRENVSAANLNGSIGHRSQQGSSFNRGETKVQFETFDSSMDERRDEKLVFKYIQRMEPLELKNHLKAT